MGFSPLGIAKALFVFTAGAQHALAGRPSNFALAQPLDLAPAPSAVGVVAPQNWYCVTHGPLQTCSTQDPRAALYCPADIAADTDVNVCYTAHVTGVPPAMPNYSAAESQAVCDAMTTRKTTDAC